LEKCDLTHFGHAVTPHHPKILLFQKFKVIIDEGYWSVKDLSFREEVLIWYTDGSRAD
jgi:hypothetical protein